MSLKIKVIYITEIPNPFQYEFTEGLKRHLGEQVTLNVVFENAAFEFRKHWRTPLFGEVLRKDGKKKHFRDILKKFNPDLILFTRYNSLTTFIGVNWCKKHSKPFYFGPHEIINPENSGFLKRSLKRLYYRYITSKSDGIATMGNQSIREISRNYRGVVINCPYTFSLQKLLDMRIPHYDDGVVFLYSGRLYDFRNPLLCITLFNIIKLRNPNKKLSLIISGDGPLKSKCLDLIEKNDLTENVIWLNDFRDWYDIHNLYSNAHVLLALQHYGTWGIIIQEAMAAGLAIISSNLIQAADNLIVNDYNGFLVNLNNSEILEKMQSYVDDPSLISLHGSRSKEIAKTVDLEKISLNYYNMIKSSFTKL